MAQPDHILAHTHASHHRAELMRSEACGCFDCLRTFEPRAIVDWVDHDTTAICPHCGIDSVIGTAAGFPVTEAFLRKMHQHWFERLTRFLTDYQGTAVRLTDERLAHIMEHPEMRGLERAIHVALASPELVVRSLSDSQVHLYYHLEQRTPVGTKLLCVVVKFPPGDAFVVTAYLTDKPKKGEVLWTAKP